MEGGGEGREQLAWIQYRSASGREPVARFIGGLDRRDAIAIRAEMEKVATVGRTAARHLRGDLYEVRASGRDARFRVVFASAGAGRLVALAAFKKTSRRTPRQVMGLAERRLREFRQRGGG